MAAPLPVPPGRTRHPARRRPPRRNEGAAAARAAGPPSLTVPRGTRDHVVEGDGVFEEGEVRVGHLRPEDVQLAPGSPRRCRPGTPGDVAALAADHQGRHADPGSTSRQSCAQWSKSSGTPAYGGVDRSRRRRSPQLRVRLAGEHAVHENLGTCPHRVRRRSDPGRSNRRPRRWRRTRPARGGHPRNRGHRGRLVDGHEPSEPSVPCRSMKLHRRRHPSTSPAHRPGPARDGEQLAQVGASRAIR